MEPCRGGERVDPSSHVASSLYNALLSFPNKIVALQFEWQWQHPKSSRILRRLLDFNAHGRGWRCNLRVLGALLRTPLWDQLGLTVHLLADDAMAVFSSLGGPGRAVRSSPEDLDPSDPGETREAQEAACGLCGTGEGRLWRCLCSAAAHLVCSARLSTPPRGELLPSRLTCATCGADTRLSVAVLSSFVVKAGRVSLAPAVDEEEEEDSEDDYTSDVSEAMQTEDDSVLCSAEM